MRGLCAMVVALLLMNLGLVIHADDKPKPRVPTAAEKKELQKQRKEKLKEREQRAKDNAKQHEELAAKIRAALEPRDKKGLSGCVLFAKDGKVIFKQAYGLADKEAKRKNTPETYFDAGRVTRLAIAMAVLKLEMEGKLSLEDKLSKFFGHAPAATGIITLMQLLSDTSGITTDDVLANADPGSRDDVIRRLLNGPLTHQPGSAVLVNSRNFNIAAAVIEVVTRQKFEDYVRKAVLEPAGMKESGFCPAGKLDKKRGAVCYTDGKREHEVLEYEPSWRSKGSGALAVTAEDLWRLNESIEWSDVLDKEAREKLFKEVLEGHCLSLTMNVTGFYDKSGHLIGDTSWGANAYLVRYPAKDAALIVLTNEELKEPIEREIISDIEKALAGG